jgi:hypothetical protein
MLKWFVLATAAARSGLAIAGPVSVQPAAGRIYTLGPGRIAASLAVVVGLIGAVTAGLAIARSARRSGSGDGRRRAIVALVMGPISLVIGALVVATADGGLGTGHGFGGGIVAIVLGLIGMALGGLALTRSRRTGSP